MAWEACPECGRKCQGYVRFREHIRTHPGLATLMRLRGEQDFLVSCEHDLAEHHEIVEALAFPIGPRVRRLLERERDRWTKGWEESSGDSLSFLQMRLERREAKVAELRAKLAEEVKL